MKLECWMYGGKTDAWMDSGLKDYQSRIKRYISFDSKVIGLTARSNKKTAEQIKEEEGNLLLHALKPNDHLVLLDERGRQLTSVAFAAHIQKKLNILPSRMIFAIGGAHGFSEEVYKRSNSLLALSNMTLPHQLARLFFMEQLYRAFSIINNHPYHHV